MDSLLLQKLQKSKKQPISFAPSGSKKDSVSHGALRVCVPAFQKTRLLVFVVIWLQNNPPPRCPSDHQRRRSSCVEHLSGTAPVFLNTQAKRQEAIRINVTQLLFFNNHLVLQTLAYVIKLIGVFFVVVPFGRWLRDSEEQRTMCELQRVSSCKEMARQPGFAPPPCGSKACAATREATTYPPPAFCMGLQHLPAWTMRSPSIRNCRTRQRPASIALQP